MELLTSVICDSASDYGGKLCILGAFDTVWSTKFPNQHPHCDHEDHQLPDVPQELPLEMEGPWEAEQDAAVWLQETNAEDLLTKGPLWGPHRDPKRLRQES